MGKLKVTLACGDYDRVGPLKDGRVQPEGVDLNFIPLEPEELFFRHGALSGVRCLRALPGLFHHRQGPGKRGLHRHSSTSRRK